MSLVFLKYLVIFIMILFVIIFSFLVWFLIKNDLSIFKEFFKTKPLMSLYEETYKKMKFKQLKKELRKLYNTKKDISLAQILKQVKEQKNNNGIN